uniref:Macaca fascicularis brain cDNA clone: QflA-20692, similar to human sortilin-related VPS10 domain containing receptor 1(SORCS1), mRNA, RefSeq: NM_052918.2 n=1 Tax=Macaca fascicularis TaxID=9541 RepID=I7GCY1_MACFA|nr:unnamed protein product [Macaca fascicularis]
MSKCYTFSLRRAALPSPPSPSTQPGDSSLQLQRARHATPPSTPKRGSAGAQYAI